MRLHRRARERRIIAEERIGTVAVVFASRRNAADAAGYAAAAQAMDALAARQPGYRGVDSARDVDGTGVTVSYWADEAAARAWRDHPDHAAIRDAGRAIWYDSYRVTICTVERDYAWSRG